MKWNSHRISLFLLSALLLFAGFGMNLWRVADGDWFRNFDRTSESLSLGRMVLSRQEGLFSHAGLTGQLKERADGPQSMHLLGEFQYSAYLHNLPYEDVQIYRSRSGATELIYSIVDQSLPLLPEKRLAILRGIGALLLAITLSLILMWFYALFGWPVYVAVLFSMTCSMWIVVMGRNLWWGLWIAYIPMVIATLALQSEGKKGRFGFGRIVFLSFLSLLLKCVLNGYEFITTVLIMMTVPYVFYGVLYRWGVRKLIGRLAATALGSLVAIGMTMVLLSQQIAIAKGENGFAHIINTFGKRAHGNTAYHGEQFAESLNAGGFSVIITYLQAAWLDINHLIYSGNRWVAENIHTIRFSYLIALFLVVTIILLVRRQRADGATKGRLTPALISATWYSLLAPLSWFIVFKAHAYIHTHIDPIVWHMPFTLFGFALCGLLLGELIRHRRGTQRVSAGP